MSEIRGEREKHEEFRKFGPDREFTVESRLKAAKMEIAKLRQLAFEKDAEIERLREDVARMEGEINALRKFCSDRSCNHAWDREWRDERTGRIYRNCVICGVKIEVP